VLCGLAARAWQWRAAVVATKPCLCSALVRRAPAEGIGEHGAPCRRLPCGASAGETASRRRPWSRVRLNPSDSGRTRPWRVQWLQATHGVQPVESALARSGLGACGCNRGVSAIWADACGGELRECTRAAGAEHERARTAAAMGESGGASAGVQRKPPKDQKAWLVRVSEHASVSGEQLQPWVDIGGRDAVLCISAWWQTEPTSSGPRAPVLGEVAAWTAAVAPASMNSAVVSKLRLRGPRLRAFGVWVFVTALCVCSGRARKTRP
jgi:hypothetical protein